MHTDALPSSVRYIKNGRGGCWWPVAKRDNEVHAGWREIPSNLIENPKDLSEIKHAYANTSHASKDPGAFKRDLNQLLMLLDQPSRHIWITFEKGCLWWCTVGDRAKSNPNKANEKESGFWLTCEHGWDNRSTTGRVLARADLPGIVERVSGFRDTVCKPREEAAILRLLRGEADPRAIEADAAGRAYAAAIGQMVSQLKWQDFEQLIDLILARTSWTRLSKTGGYQEGFDIEAQNLTADEIAWVQVKSEASQVELNTYVNEFAERERYQRGIFAVHNPKGGLVASAPIRVWERDEIAWLAVRLGLGEWIARKLG